MIDLTFTKDNCMHWLHVLELLAPAILTLVPGGPIAAPLVIAGMKIAEAAGGSGPDKKQIAKDATKLGAQAANAVAKTTVIDPEAAAAVADDAIDAVIGATNLVHRAIQAKQPAA